MKLIYLKPRRFPQWAKPKTYSTSERYLLESNGISADFDANSKLPYANHVEMAGFGASAIISYRVGKDRTLDLYRFCAFPELRVNPNDTRGTLTHKFCGANFSQKEIVEKICFDGILTFHSKIDAVAIKREMTASKDKKAILEKLTLTNNSVNDSVICLNNKNMQKNIKRAYTANNEQIFLHTVIHCKGKELSHKKNTLAIKSGETINIMIAYGSDRLNENQAYKQFEKRKQFLEDCKNRLIIKTPDKNINSFLEFCKIRSSESIFTTKNGLMHSPGGGGYYGALWTNDQCEYANPYFAYLGYDKAIEQSYNCYNLYSNFASETKVIPTSIIACGDDIWHGAGDRGDNSMYLYGLSRFLLTMGDKNKATEYLEHIKKATKYVVSQINKDNIVESDSDELENRFESGKANLSTSSITYDAFLSLSYLYDELDDSDAAEEYRVYAKRIKNGIEKYFGAIINGFETYKYCNEEKDLRAWICIPLTVGIFDRKDDTVKALLSDYLCKDGYILTKSGVKTYWDRTTLYALKGFFCAGKQEYAIKLLENYTSQRLLGDHAPYPVEAFPEGNAAQLSGESALYIRIFIEGILGFRPVGFGKLILKPNMPEKWNHISVENFYVSQKKVSILIEKEGEQYKIDIDGQKHVVQTGEELLITLNN